MELKYGVYKQNLFITSLIFQENTTIELTKMARILSSVDENENLANKRIGDLQTGTVFSYSYFHIVI